MVHDVQETFKGRVTDFLYAPITGQGITPLCVPRVLPAPALALPPSDS